MNNTKNIATSLLWNLVVVFLALLVTYLLSPGFGQTENILLGKNSISYGSSIFTAWAGLFIGYFFIVPLFLLLFGGLERTWCAGILILIGLMFAITNQLEVTSVAEFLLISIVGLVFGFLGRKILSKYFPRGFGR